MGNKYQILKSLINSSKQIINLQKSKLDTLSSKDFPNKTSYELITLMLEICKHTEDFLEKLTKEFENAKSESDYEEIESDLIQITQYLGWLSATAIDALELSTRERISQDSIFLLNYFTKPFSEKSRFVLIPTDEHNFMIAEWGKMFETILKLLDVNPKNLSISPDAFSIISFPSIFKDNLVAHSSLGHEIGHFIISEYSLIDQITPKIILNSTKLTQVIDKEIAKRRAEDGTDPSTFQKNTIKLQQNIRIRKKISLGIEEFLADFIGLKILGPVFLFASTEFLLSDTPKHYAGPEHPPPSLRIHVMIQELKSKKYLEQISNEHKNLKNSIDELVKNIEDFVTPINVPSEDLEYQIKHEAWNNLMPTLTQIVDDTIDKIEGLVYPPKSFGDETPPLIKKLKLLIPPCEIEQGKPADLVSILNAGMIFRLLREKLLPDVSKETEAAIDPLVIRAAHQSVIQEKIQSAMEITKDV